MGSLELWYHTQRNYQKLGEGPENDSPSGLSEGTHPASALQPLDSEVVTFCCLNTQFVRSWCSSPSKLIRYWNTVSTHSLSLARTWLPLSLLSSQNLKINISLKSDPWDFYLTWSSSRDPHFRQWHHHPNKWTSQNSRKVILDSSSPPCPTQHTHAHTHIHEHT